MHTYHINFGASSYDAVQSLWWFNAHMRFPAKMGRRPLRSTRYEQKKNRDLELRYMFLGQIFAKNAKNDPKTLFEASKSVKK